MLKWLSGRGRIAAVLGILGLVLAGFGAGIATEFLAHPTKMVQRAVRKIVPAAPPPAVKAADVESIFLTFKRESVQVPITRHGRGGGLTVVDNHAGLSTIDGKLYLASSTEDVKPLAIAVPDYGFAAYRAFAEDPANSKYHFELWAYRYFDILAFDFAGSKHLALSFVKFEPERQCFHTIVSVLDIPSTAADLAGFTATAGDWRTAFVTEPCLPIKTTQSALEVQIGGGRMAYDGKGRLYLGSGDYHIDGVFSEMPAIAQDPAHDYGKVIEIDLATGQGRQIAQGLRNMQGIAFDAAGQLWTVEHGLRGGDELIFLTEAPNGQAETFLTDYLVGAELSPHVRERLHSNINTCLTCHSLDPDVNTFAPSLAAVVGARIGSTRYASYSDWMRAQETTWTPERLTEFLANPEAVAPGTTMPAPGFGNAEEIGAVVDFLAAMASPLEFSPAAADTPEAITN